uniref:Uncharacterized protein n=1 Tax=Arundo donax TaxID=35708 RepID=A0A0A8YB11_ARUDO
MFFYLTNSIHFYVLVHHMC